MASDTPAPHPRGPLRLAAAKPTQASPTSRRAISGHDPSSPSPRDVRPCPLPSVVWRTTPSRRRLRKRVLSRSNKGRRLARDGSRDGPASRQGGPRIPPAPGLRRHSRGGPAPRGVIRRHHYVPCLGARSRSHLTSQGVLSPPLPRRPPSHGHAERRQSGTSYISATLVGTGSTPPSLSLARRHAEQGPSGHRLSRASVRAPPCRRRIYLLREPANPASRTRQPCPAVFHRSNGLRATRECHEPDFPAAG